MGVFTAAFADAVGVPPDGVLATQALQAPVVPNVPNIAPVFSAAAGTMTEPGVSAGPVLMGDFNTHSGATAATGLAIAAPDPYAEHGPVEHDGVGEKVASHEVTLIAAAYEALSGGRGARASGMAALAAFQPAGPTFNPVTPNSNTTGQTPGLSGNFNGQAVGQPSLMAQMNSDPAFAQKIVDHMHAIAVCQDQPPSVQLQTYKTTTENTDVQHIDRQNTANFVQATEAHEAIKDLKNIVREEASSPPASAPDAGIAHKFTATASPSPPSPEESVRIAAAGQGTISGNHTTDLATADAGGSMSSAYTGASAMTPQANSGNSPNSVMYLHGPGLEDLAGRVTLVGGNSLANLQFDGKSLDRLDTETAATLKSSREAAWGMNKIAQGVETDIGTAQNLGSNVRKEGYSPETQSVRVFQLDRSGPGGRA